MVFMINELRLLRVELDSFWTWAYQQCGDNAEALLGVGEWAADYPQMGAVYQAVKAVVARSSNVFFTEQCADLLLEAIAIDNECEHIQDICGELPDSALGCLFQRAVVTRFPDARWQVASMIGKTRNIEWTSCLLVFLDDADMYVERRALLALGEINPIQAEKAALERIGHSDNYMRLAAVNVLIKINSPKLVDVREQLLNDSCFYVREKAREIEG